MEEANSNLYSTLQTKEEELEEIQGAVMEHKSQVTIKKAEIFKLEEELQ